MPYQFVVTIDAATEWEARKVMNERIGYDEDYGFPYTITDYALTTPTNTDTTEVDA